jgi:hypothetical protein
MELRTCLLWSNPSWSTTRSESISGADAGTAPSALRWRFELKRTKMPEGSASGTRL